MNLKSINLKYRAVLRFNNIVSILLKNGLGYVVHKIKIFKLPFIKVSGKKYSKIPDNLPAAIRKTFEDLGPTFIKLGQILSTRYDLLPDSYINEFIKLQDEVQSVEFSKIESIIISEFTENYQQVFVNIDKVPIGSASICQVYLGTLKNNDKVILKILRPNIKNIVETDIEISKVFSRLLKNYLPEIGIDFMDIINDFETSIMKELDLKNEANNIRRFTNNFKSSSNVIIPEIYDSLCSKNILVMKYYDGIKLTDLDKIKESGIDLNRIMDVGTKSIIKQIFVDGFFHADPHPGNIMALPDNKLVFIDFGITGSLSEEHKKYLFDLTLAILEKDTNRIFYILLEMNAVQYEIESVSFKNDVYYAIEEFLEIPLKDINIYNIFDKLILLINKYNIIIPSSYILLLKSLIILDGIGKKIRPDFNLIIELKPNMKKIISNYYSFTYLFKTLRKRTQDLIYFSKDLPFDFKEIIQKIKRGQLQIEFEHRGLESLERTINFSSTLLAVALLTGSLMISSSFILTITFTENLSYLFVPSIIGFSISGFLSLYVIYRSFRKK